MRLTKAGEYAVRCVLYLAMNEGEKVISRREIASAMAIPNQFLAKIAQNLSKAGIIRISQGAHGGYQLAVEAGDITLLRVVEAADGEIFLNDCLIQNDICNRVGACPVHGVWQKARERLRETLGEVNFGELAREEMKKKRLS